MNELAVFLLVFQMARHCSGVYLHESSRVVIHHPKNEAKTDFGFAMAYQNGINTQRLVVGAPRDTYIGKVFACPIENVTRVAESSQCDEVAIDFETLTEDSNVNDSRVAFPDQSYFLGASISATPDYFLTCAPLMTAQISTLKSRNSSQSRFDVTGACFVYNGTDFTRYFDVYERYIHELPMVKSKRRGIPERTFVGGTGWNSLVDDKNELLLVTKSSLSGDMLYGPLQEPTKMIKSRALSWYTYNGNQGLKYASDVEYVHGQTNAGFGVTAGNFFSDKNVYAFSLQTKSTSGEILFLEYDQKLSKLITIVHNGKQQVKFVCDDIGSAFGSVLTSADLNQDGYADFLVGAPTLSDSDYGPELGAVHIYRGGVESMKDKNVKRTIIGEKVYGRFGSAIATSDIDEDGIPDIFVSAPYENENVGALYVFNGYDIKSLISQEAGSKHKVSQLKYQKIQVEGLRNFGYSLQVVPDNNSKTCFGLAASAPASNSVIFFRCLPAIHVELKEPVGSQVVSTLAPQFTVQLCAQVRYPSKPSKINTYLMLTSRIKSQFAEINSTEATKKIDLSLRKETNCHDFIVDIEVGSDIDRFLVEAEVELDSKMITDVREGKEFKDTWVTLTEQSKRTVQFTVYRHCTAEKCNPKLSLTIKFSGDKNGRYILGSSKSETVHFTVRNDAYNSYTGCVIFSIQGTPAGLIKDQYDLVKPLRTLKEDIHTKIINFANPSNTYDMLIIEAELREKCEISTNNTQMFNVSYGFNTDEVYVKGISIERVIAESTGSNESKEVLKDTHEYQIINNGPINWKDVYAVIKIEDQPYFTNISINRLCDKYLNGNSTTFNCTLDLMNNSTQEIRITAELSKETLLKAVEVGKLKSSSELILYLRPTEDEKNKSITTLFIGKELSLANDKDFILIISIVVAWLILAVVTYILYKRNFFARKQKKNLAVLRESVRRHSIKKSVSERARSSCTDGEPLTNTDVLEDPFDEAQPKATNNTTTAASSDAIQTKEQAQVHSE